MVEPSQVSSHSRKTGCNPHAGARGTWRNQAQRGQGWDSGQKMTPGQPGAKTTDPEIPRIGLTGLPHLDPWAP